MEKDATRTMAELEALAKTWQDLAEAVTAQAEADGIPSEIAIGTMLDVAFALAVRRVGAARMLGYLRGVARAILGEVQARNAGQQGRKH